MSQLKLLTVLANCVRPKGRKVKWIKGVPFTFVKVQDEYVELWRCEICRRIQDELIAHAEWEIWNRS